MIWRDIKVYDDHAFIVSEAREHGMQVFDLTQLRTIERRQAPVELTETAHYSGFGRAHNVGINEDTGYAYVVGAREDLHGCAGGLHMVDVRQPASPTFAGVSRRTATSTTRSAWSMTDRMRASPAARSASTPTRTPSRSST